MADRRLYFDYAASTPVDKAVREAMQVYFTEKFGNPGSLHSFGQEAIAALDEARERVASALGADFREIVFTGSATEANNLALRGVVKSVQFASHSAPRVIVSAVEHESVLDTARALEREGAEVVILPVSREGVVDTGKLQASLDARTVLVSVLYGNNEIGTIQPIAEIGKVLVGFRRKQKSAHYPLFHTDAAQAFQFLDCEVARLGVDLMTLSAHKIYGPKGVGALYVRNLKSEPLPLEPILTGGGQEFGLRSGTEHVPLIVGFGKAVELVMRRRARESARLTQLKEYFWSRLQKIEPKAQLNGAGGLPHILNVYFPGHPAQELLTAADLSGMAVSAGSACRARSLESSHVLRALGYPEERVRASLRFSFGRPTQKAEVDRGLRILQELLTP